MAIVQALTTQFKLDILNAVHANADVYKIALYTSSASLGAGTTAYTMTGEVASTGNYVAGGVTLAGLVITSFSTTAFIDWTTDPSWSSATITARGAMIYNFTKSNKAMAILDFGSDQVSTNGTFTIVLPVATADATGAANAIIRVA